MVDVLKNHENRIKILFVIPSLRGGGAERVFTQLANHIDKEKFDLKLIVLNLKDSVFQSEIQDDIEIINLKSNRVRNSIFKIIGAIRKVKPDIVFSTLGHLNLFLALIKPFFPKKTVFIARETSVVSEKLGQMRFKVFWVFLYRIVKNRFDCLVCQSQDMKDDLELNFKYEGLVVINNPIDIDGIRGKVKKSSKQRSKEKLHLLAVGRLQYQKGFDILIDAIYLLKDTNIRLSILGKGPLEQALHSQIQTLGLEDQVKMVGFQENPYQWMVESDALVLSSRFEGFSNVVLESLALQTPVVALPAKGGIYEILSSIDGCVIAEEHSADSLSQAVLEWVEFRKVIPIGVVDKYSINVITQKYENLFLELVNETFAREELEKS